MALVCHVSWTPDIEVVFAHISWAPQFTTCHPPVEDYFYILGGTIQARVEL